MIHFAEYGILCFSEGKWLNDLNMFYETYDVVGNRDKVDETIARIPVGSPICLRSEHTRMYLK